MFDEKDLQKLILAYERELLALKQAHNISPSINLNVAKYSGSGVKILYIHYESGKDDIVTDAYASSNAIFCPVNGNVQKVLFYNNVSDVVFVSTRKILGVVV